MNDDLFKTWFDKSKNRDTKKYLGRAVLAIIIIYLAWQYYTIRKANKERRKQATEQNIKAFD